MPTRQNKTIKKFTKITVGFVSQTFEQNDKDEMVCTEQEFIAGDEVSYEDEHGEPIIFFPKCQYQSYNMVQPEQPRRFSIRELISDGEVSEVQANSLEEALSNEFERMGYEIKEVEEQEQ